MAAYTFKRVIIILFSLLIQNNVFAEDRLPVFVSIAPQKYFVEQIGRDLVDVQVMVQPGASPHTYEPKPLQMAALAKSELYFSIGVTFENVWLNKISASNPNLRIIHTDENIRKIPMSGHHHHEITHGEEIHNQESEHDHHAHHHDGILDPHIWLSPPLVKIQALAILNALQEADPANSPKYESNYEEFISEIDLLHADLEKIFSGKRGTPFMVFHPSWGYFAEAYGIIQVPIEVEGKDPKPAQLMELIKYAQKREIKVIFVQPQFSFRNAEMIAKESCFH